MNLIIVTGRLGKDPEVRNTPGGKAVANFSIAVKDYQTKKDNPLWLNVVCWDKLAEIVKEYGAKGRDATIQGRLQIREYEANGESRKSIEIVANTVEFASTGNRESGSGESAQTRSSKPSGNRTSRRDEPPIDDSF